MPEPPPITELLTQMTQVMTQMAQFQANQQVNQAVPRVSIKEFLSLGPRAFVATREPLAFALDIIEVRKYYNAFQPIGSEVGYKCAYIPGGETPHTLN